MKTQLFKLTALAGALVLTTGAHAAASYGNLNTAAFLSSGTPAYQDAVYMGTGGSVQNGDWTIDTAGNLEVALRAKNRGTFALVDGSSGTYTFDAGTCNQTGACSGSNKAWWNYEFSVNARADGSGSNDLTGMTVQVRVDTDETAANAFTAWTDVTSNWPDNAYWDGVTGDGRRVGTGPVQAGEYGLQQSVNPMFGNSLFQPGFNPWIAGEYRVEMRVIDASQQVMAATGINVRVLPEPTSLALVGLAFAGLGFAARRKA